MRTRNTGGGVRMLREEVKSKRRRRRQTAGNKQKREAKESERHLETTLGAGLYTVV